MACSARDHPEEAINIKQIQGKSCSVPVLVRKWHSHVWLGKHKMGSTLGKAPLVSINISNFYLGIYEKNNSLFFTIAVFIIIHIIRELVM